MKRPFLWLLLVGGVAASLGVLWQAFTIAAYVRGAGEGALDPTVPARSSCTSATSQP